MRFARAAGEGDVLPSLSSNSARESESGYVDFLFNFFDSRKVEIKIEARSAR